MSSAFRVKPEKMYVVLEIREDSHARSEPKVNVNTDR